jgi:Flp pilus assembly pilin Flp
MKDIITGLSAKVQSTLMPQEGQDLVEYALVTSVISFGLIVVLGTLSNDISTVFSNIANKLTSATA